MYAIPKGRDAVAPGLGGDPAAAPHCRLGDYRGLSSRRINPGPQSKPPLLFFLRISTIALHLSHTAVVKAGGSSGSVTDQCIGNCRGILRL
jgi:hypothetical protein